MWGAYEATIIHLVINMSGTCGALHGHLWQKKTDEGDIWLLPPSAQERNITSVLSLMARTCHVAPN